MPPYSPRTRRLLLTFAIVIGLWALVVWISGGGVLSVGPLRVSSRSTLRPALAAIALTLAALWRAAPDARASEYAWVAGGLDRAAPWLAALTALALAATSALYNEHVAGGADSSGYLHQAALWEGGQVTMPAPVISDAPWPERGWQVAPLGFAPAVTPGELGPSYAPGLPWLMALGTMVAGDVGRYLWTPAAAGLMVWLTFVLTRREATPSVGLAAALLVATSPAVLFASMQTMSDLLCATLWTAVIIGLGPAPSPRLVATGLAAAVALVVRPNLVPAAALVGLAAVLAVPGPWRHRLARAIALGGPLALAAAAIAWVNRRLWGSPLSSGYGATEDLFIATRVPDNLAHLWRWTVETRAWWLPAGGLALLVLFIVPPLLSRHRRLRLVPALALVAGVLVSYLPYAVFEEWWYLRFYLAAWPVLAMAVTVVVWQLGARWSSPLAAIGLVVAAVVLAGPGFRVVTQVGVLDLWRGAQRYPAVAGWVLSHAPPGSVLLSVQHSGSLSAAGAATVARWDWLTGDTLDGRVAQLSVAGRPAWAVLDDWEEAHWRRHFAGQARGRLDWAPLAEARIGPSRVRIYDLADPTRAVAPDLIRVVVGGPWPWRRQPMLGTAR